MGIEYVLKKTGAYTCKTVGDSMLPMLREGRDTVVITLPEFPLKKYDVPVYRRDGRYIMHRIIRVTRKGEYVICGDNRVCLEKDITDKDIIGVLHGFYREAHFYSCGDKEYIKYAKRVCRRYYIRLVRHFLYAVKRKITKTY